MAENRPGGEPTEPASEKKLRDARRRGEVARSREVVSGAVFIAAAATVAWSWPQVVNRLRELLHTSLTAAPLSQVAPLPALQGGLRTLALAVAPILAAALVAAVIGNLAQVRGLFALHPIKPDLQRLNPAKNIGQLFGKRAAVELCKSLIKIVGIGYLGFVVLWDHAPRIIATVGAPPERILGVVATCLAALAVRVGLLVLVLAAADVLYQRHAFMRRQRMTKEEVRREHKDQEGDPQRKAERQRVQREVLEHLMVESVARADCVIINPTRIAVALSYDPAAAQAPKVVASGQRLMAARIREIARQHGVPIVRNVPLARALVELDLDQEIPHELYQAVAEVLRFVYRISGDDRTRSGDRPSGV